MVLDFSSIKKIDWILVGAIILISLASLLTIYSSTTNRELAFSLFKKQLLFLAIAFFIFFIFALWDYRIFINRSYLIIFIYLLSCFLLIITLFFARKIRGAASWLHFGFLNFQPVELAKFSIVLFLVKYFSQRHTEIHRFIHILISGIYVGFPTFLVLLQPDFGSAIILVILWIFIMIISGIKIKHLFLLSLLFSLFFVIFWFFVFHPYQKERILSFLNPQKDPFGAGYNLIQSLIAIGTGGILGQGLGRGTQVQMGFLPESHTDFIFAAFSEEWGFLGSLFLLLLYFLVIWRLIKVGEKSKNNFSFLFVSCVVILFVSHIFINIGMNLGLLPITGISLPLFSAGGSNLILFFALFGISQSIAVRS